MEECIKWFKDEKYTEAYAESVWKRAGEYDKAYAKCSSAPPPAVDPVRTGDEDTGAFRHLDRSKWNVSVETFETLENASEETPVELKKDELNKRLLSASDGKKEDEKRFWFLDFHWPKGLSPMGITFLEDGYSWSTQTAAQGLPLPPGKGIVQRLGGTHVYASEVPVTSEWEMGFRGARIEKNLPPFLQNFPDIWKDRVWELDMGLEYLSLIHI